jgi:hypothetical protein
MNSSEHGGVGRTKPDPTLRAWPRRSAPVADGLRSGSASGDGSVSNRLSHPRPARVDRRPERSGLPKGASRNDAVRTCQYVAASGHGPIDARGASSELSPHNRGSLSEYWATASRRDRSGGARGARVSMTAGLDGCSSSSSRVLRREDTRRSTGVSANASQGRWLGDRQRLTARTDD